MDDGGVGGLALIILGALAICQATAGHALQRLGLVSS